MVFLGIICLLAGIALIVFGVLSCIGITAVPGGNTYNYVQAGGLALIGLSFFFTFLLHVVVANAFISTMQYLLLFAGLAVCIAANLNCKE